MFLKHCWVFREDQLPEYARNYLLMENIGTLSFVDTCVMEGGLCQIDGYREELAANCLARRMVLPLLPFSDTRGGREL